MSCCGVWPVLLFTFSFSPSVERSNIIREICHCLLHLNTLHVGVFMLFIGYRGHPTRSFYLRLNFRRHDHTQSCGSFSTDHHLKQRNLSFVTTCGIDFQFFLPSIPRIQRQPIGASGRLCGYRYMSCLRCASRVLKLLRGDNLGYILRSSRRI